MMNLLIALALPAQLGAASLSSDSVAALRESARSAESAFERLSRQRAPATFRTFSGSDCDEIVGRFCLRFDPSETPPDRPEDDRVARARADAVEAARRYFSAAPGARDAAGPLVRLLIADGRAGEAVPAARAFAALGDDTLWGELLLGLARHAAGADSSAEAHFARGLAHLEPGERRAWLDPEWLIEPREWNELRRLPDAERAELERRFWIAADPFWMTDANERWVEHVARRVQTQLLADVPRVVDMLRWGRDLDELTIRYGVPVARSRSRGPPGSMRSSLVEYWDSAQRAYDVERPSAGVPPQPLPGDPLPLYNERARSTYAYSPVSRVLELSHQATRFLSGDYLVVRVDGVIPAPAEPGSPEPGSPEPAASGSTAPVAVAVVAYDSAFGTRRRMPGTAAWHGDSARFTLQLRAPAGALVYGVEALDTAADVAARARYTLDELVASDGPIVSDLLIARPFAAGPLPARRDDPRIRAHASLVLARGDTLGLYAEAYRLTTTGADALSIELALEPVDRPSLPGEIARWIGRAIGLAGERAAPRVSWRADGRDVVHAIALNLPLDRRLRGRQALVLRVTDLATGLSTESRRVILIVDRPSPP